MKYGPVAAIIILGLLLSPALGAIGGSQSQQTASISSPSLPGSGTSERGYAQLQYGPPLAGEYSLTQSASTADYYTQAPPSAQQASLLPYTSSTAKGSLVYYSGSYIPLSQFGSAFGRASPAFWMLTSRGWSWFAFIPLGGWVQELMYMPFDGQVTAYEIYPSGMTRTASFGYTSPGYRYMWFYADVPGRHVTIFTIDGVPSNAVTIDVTNQVVSQPTAYPPIVPYYDDYSDMFAGNSFDTIGISTGARGES